MPGTQAVLEPTAVAVEPVGRVSCQVRVRNTTPAAVTIGLTVEGGVAGWAWASPSQMEVGAGDEGLGRLVLRPPGASGAPPGRVGFQVVVTDLGSRWSKGLEGVVDVEPYVELVAVVVPKVGRGAEVERLHGHAREPRELGGGGDAGGCERRPSPRGRGDARRGGARFLEPGPGPAHGPSPSTVPGPQAPGSPGPPDGERRGSGRGGRHASTASSAMDRLGGRPAARAGWRLPGIRRGEEDAGEADRTTVLAEAPPPPEPRYAGWSMRQIFVDRSRATNAHGSVAAQPERSLSTLVLYPAAGEPRREVVEGADAAAGVGPYPLIVFAHGSGGDVEGYTTMLSAWAAAGYVVAAPTFPFASIPEEASSDDYQNQPIDMSFVVDEVLRLASSPDTPLQGLVDGGRVGAAGHSIRGMTTLALAANTCCHDPRIKAAAVLAGREVPFSAGEFYSGIRTPLLLVHGDDDRSVRFADAERTYAAAPPPKFFVTLLGGDHGEPFHGDPTRPDVRVVLAATLDLFDHYLRDAPDGLERLSTDANVAGVATLVQEL